MRPSAFLFDLDGTLVDTEMPWTRAIVAWLAERSVAASEEEIAPMLVGRSWFDIHAALHVKYPTLEKSSPVEDARTLRPFYDQVVPDPTALVIPTSVEFLRQAAKIAPCVVVSGSPHADVQGAVELCGITQQVKFVLGVEDYTRGKPAPDGFLRAAELLDVDASQCVVIEDATAGVAAGRAAGMHVVGLDRNPNCPQNLSGCEWLVRDLSELNVEAEFGS